MTFELDVAHKEIEQRNMVRRECGLPLLQRDIEARRLMKVHEENQFKLYFEAQRRRFEHLWSDSSRGFWTNMGIYTGFRQFLRREMNNQRISSST